MTNIREEHNKELNSGASELLAAIDNYRRIIEKGDAFGKPGILRGITIFEGVIRDVNPNVIDEKVETTIQQSVETYLVRKEDNMQHVDTVARRGISTCLIILSNHTKRSSESKETKGQKRTRKSDKSYLLL